MKQAEAVICVVGTEAGTAVLEELEHWGGAHHVAVIGDGRRRERRRSERRAYEWSAENGPPPTDLRKVRSHNGRRLATLEPHDLEGLRKDQALEPYMPGWLDDADLLMLFERLPLLQQRVLLLRYLLDLSGAEIAKALDLSPENVRQLQLRALAF